MSVRFPGRMHEEMKAAAAAANMPLREWLRSSVSYSLRHKDRVTAYREIQLAPRSGSTIDTMLEWLAGRRGVVADIMHAPSAPSARIARVLRTELSEEQARRVCYVLLEGRKLEEVAHLEGVSKQAVDQSLKRAYARLQKSDAFIAALCAAFPDSGITPEMLKKASNA